MKTATAMNDTEYILSQLKLYYDCRLTDAEESRLRFLVAHSASTHPEIECARAIMGFRHPRRRMHTGRRYAATAAAASLLLLVVAGIGWLNGTPQVADSSFAYSGGVYISDESEVLDLLAQNLSEFGGDIEDADQSMASDLQEFAAFIPENLNLQ